MAVAVRRRRPSGPGWKKVPATLSPAFSADTPSPDRDHLARAVRQRDRVLRHLLE